MRLDIHITGLGLIGSAGSTPEENWQALREGKNNFSRESTVTQSRLNAKTEASFAELQKGKPSEAIERAVHNMLPKNKLRADRMARLKVYPTTEHPHQSQIGK